CPPRAWSGRRWSPWCWPTPCASSSAAIASTKRCATSSRIERRMDNLILVGFSCSGKTTLGRNVARRLRLNFVDTDRYIEEMAGRTIPEIFREDGETAFRALESEAIERIMRQRNQVVSTGGGAFVDPNNRQRLRDG